MTEEKNVEYSYSAIGDNIVVDPKIKDETDSGIKLLDKTAEDNKEMYPEVISVGEKVTGIKPGDKVALHHMAHPTMIPLGKRKLFNFKQYDIIGVVSEKPNLMKI